MGPLRGSCTIANADFRKMVIEITAEDFLVIEEVLLACLPPDGASVTHLKTEAALPCC